MDKHFGNGKNCCCGKIFTQAGHLGRHQKTCKKYLAAKELNE